MSLDNLDLENDVLSRTILFKILPNLLRTLLGKNSMVFNISTKFNSFGGSTRHPYFILIGNRIF